MSAPKLRFYLTSSKWNKKPIISLADYVDYRGKTPQKTESGVFLVTAKNIKQGYIDYENSQEYIDSNEYNEVMRRGKPQIGDVLITTEAPLGNIASIDREDIALAQRVIKYRGKENILNSYFLKQLFLSPKFQTEIGSKATGGTVQGIKGSVLHQINIYVPNFDEQSKIAYFLSFVDEKITFLNKQYDLLCQYKKGIMQKIFSQELRFKDENGKTFPEWKNTILDEVVDLITNGLALDQNDSKNGYPVSRIETISEHCINMNKVGFVDTDNDISNYKLNYGDMLFSNINSISHIGKIAYFDIDDILYHGMNLLRIVIKNSHSNLFFYYQLTTDTNKKYFESRANQAVSQASINQTELRKTPVQVPCQEEQTKIANFLSALDDKISTKKAELGKLKTWKQGLLQQMFV